MYYDVVKVRHIEGYKLEVVFENGKKGIVDLQSYIKEGGVFSRFSDIEYFKQAYVDKELGVLCWPDGLDIAPETLYSMATGEPLPEWIATETTEQQKEVAKKL
ncbi:MAG TPA: DUF2442 domain-containing protein [Candidatus Brocadiales bacterium]|nr:DUF2442 domain-containing protein [Candidatus Brocadiales bacterium]